MREMGAGKQRKRQGQRETESEMQRQTKAGKGESLVNTKIKEMRENESKFRGKGKWGKVQGVGCEMNRCQRKKGEWQRPKREMPKRESEGLIKQEQFLFSRSSLTAAV